MHLHTDAPLLLAVASGEAVAAVVVRGAPCGDALPRAWRGICSATGLQVLEVAAAHGHGERHAAAAAATAGGPHERDAGGRRAGAHLQRCRLRGAQLQSTTAAAVRSRACV